MKNKNLIKACLLFLTLSSLSGCGDSSVVPEVSEGKDTIISSLKGRPDENDAKNVVFATLGKLESYQTYQKTSSNQVNAVKGFINYEQKSDATMIKNGDEYYVDSSSKSAFVDMEHIALSKNNKVAYQDKNSNIKNATYDDYYSVYGVTPNKLLSGQIFNQETILLASLKDSSDGQYTYELVLDMNKANDLIAHQTKIFGGLNALPTYLEHTTFTLTIDENYSPISYSYSAKYSININVLGDLDCSETCTASFSKFNEEVSIPNIDALTKAIDESPSKIDIITPTDKDPNLVAILNALTNFDFANGVALNGTINVSNYQIPLKLSMKADLNTIIEKGFDAVKDNVDFALSFVLPTGEIKLNYHDNAFYLSALNSKTKFSVRDSDNDESLTTDDLFLFSKEGNYYVISLSPLFRNIIFTYLVNYGLFSEEDRNNFALQIKFYIVNDNISSIVGHFGGDNSKSIDINLLAGNEIFVSPAYGEYSSTLSISINSSLGIIFNSNLVNLPLEVNLTYDDSVAYFNNAISLDINAMISEIYPLISLLAGFGDNVPSFIKSIVNSNCKYVSLSLRNGTLYGVGYDLVDDVKTIRILDELSMGIDIDGLLENKDLKKFIKLLFSYVSLFGKEASELGDEIFIELVKALGINSLSNSTVGDQIYSKLGFNNPIKSHNVYVDEDGLHYEVLGYKLDTNTVYNPSLASTYESVTLFTFSLLKEGFIASSDSLTDLISSNIDMAKEVKAIYEEFERLSIDLSIEDEYLDEVNALIERFNALSDEGKAYAEKAYKNSNSKKMTEANIKKLSTDYTNNKKRITEFVDLASADTPVLSKLNTKYKQLKDFQIDYLLKYHKDSYDIYFALRKDNDAANIGDFEAKVDGIEEVDLSLLSFDELKARLDNLSTLVTESSSYLSGTVNEEKLTKLNDAFNEVVTFYFEYAKVVYENDMNSVRSLDENSPISSFLETYDKVNADITNIFKPYDKKSAILGDYYVEFMTMYKLLDYALTSTTYKSICFGRNAVFAIEKEIDSLVELTSSMSDEEIKASEEVASRVGDLKTLRGYISLDSSISNLMLLTAIENKLA